MDQAETQKHVEEGTGTILIINGLTEGQIIFICDEAGRNSLTTGWKG